MTKAKLQFAWDPLEIRALRACQNYKLAPRELWTSLKLNSTVVLKLVLIFSFNLMYDFYNSELA